MVAIFGSTSNKSLSLHLMLSRLLFLKTPVGVRRVVVCLVLAGCGQSINSADLGVADLAVRPPPDLAVKPPECPQDAGVCGCDPMCKTFSLGPEYGTPFPLLTDQPPDPNVGGNGLHPDGMGDLVLDQPVPVLDYGYVANSTDWNRGTLSKIDTRTVREVARYFTVTCGSLATGSTAACDGTNGCCARDDLARFAARLAMKADPGHQQVQLTSNFPSRTAIDFTGDAWVENRAPGGQASITEIANDPSYCVDRNKNGTIDTSRDVNGDGLIETDCNGDGVPDDMASVKGKPCTNGMAQEFFGLDDECVLFTTNVGVVGGEGRPLSLGPGAVDFGPSDPWAGTASDATIYRVEGTSGLTKDRAVLPPECAPDGLAFDSSANGWSSSTGAGPLCWFNAMSPATNGKVRMPQMGTPSGRAVSMDRDQNVWLADRTSAGAWRYTPNRKNGLADLSNGFWTQITSVGKATGVIGNAVGITLDSRSPNFYYAWLAVDDGGGNGWLVRIPGLVPLPNMDVTVDGSAYSALPLGGFAPIAVDVDRNQNVGVVSRAPSAMIRVSVDMAGAMAPPDLQSPPLGNNRCPAGERCALKDAQASDPGSDAYSQYFAWGLRCFCRPKGNYTYVVKGCANGTTQWLSITWDSVVPLNTALTLRARSGNTPQPDVSWGQWTPDYATSPADLVNGMPLVPNGDMNNPANYLQFEFDMLTMDKNVVPKLRGVQVAYTCVSPV